MSDEIGQLELEYFSPPCDICFVCTQIEKHQKIISNESTNVYGELYHDSMIEGLKSQFCDPCYDYFYDKIQIHEGIEE